MKGSSLGGILINKSKFIPTAKMKCVYNNFIHTFSGHWHGVTRSIHWQFKKNREISGLIKAKSDLILREIRHFFYKYGNDVGFFIVQLYDFFNFFIAEFSTVVNFLVYSLCFQLTKYTEY